MQETVSVKGMVLKCEPAGEYDRRVVILTAERGKITCFARGARKQGNRLMAATNPFCFGEFRLFEGKNSYSICEAAISNYFEFFREHFEEACYGMYFLELADYYTRENNDEKQILGLLYQSQRALENIKLTNSLVRAIFEIKLLIIEGEYPGILPSKVTGFTYEEAAVYALDFILNSPIEKLYTFTVSDKVLEQLRFTGRILIEKYTDRAFKSLEILDDL